MALPIKTFWMMSANVDRVAAQSDMRKLSVTVCGQGGPVAQEYRKRLVIEVGEIVKLEKAAPALPYDATRDEKGFAELKAMAKMK